MEAGSKDRYFQADQEDRSKLVPEGIEGRVPSKGPLADSVYQLIGGLRAGMGMAGADSLSAMATKARLIRVSPAAVAESHPHSVTITKEAPNYRRGF
jgi:IMP dehydrogenase